MIYDWIIIDQCNHHKNIYFKTKFHQKGKMIVYEINKHYACEFQDLMTRVRQLESHVKQLRNVVLKGQGEGQVKKKGKAREFDFKK